MNMKQRQTCCNPNLREPPAYPSIIVNAMEAVANTNKTPAYPTIIMNAMEAVANTNGMTNRGNKFVVLLLVAKKTLDNCWAGGSLQFAIRGFGFKFRW